MGLKDEVLGIIICLLFHACQVMFGYKLTNAKGVSPVIETHACHPPLAIKHDIFIICSSFIPALHLTQGGLQVKRMRSETQRGAVQANCLTWHISKGRKRERERGEERGMVIAPLQCVRSGPDAR